MKHSMIKHQQLFMMEYFKLLADYVPSDITLNQLRIIQYIGLRCLEDGPGTINTEICQALEMNKTTVTRTVARFVATGVISQKSSSADGRQQVLTMSPEYPRKGTLDQKVRQLAARYFAAD
jgi:DNA-binding MarR family transcriptional regulator